MFSPTTFDIYITNWPAGRTNSHIFETQKRNLDSDESGWKMTTKYDQHIVEDILESTSTK